MHEHYKILTQSLKLKLTRPRYQEIPVFLRETINNASVSFKDMDQSQIVAGKPVAVIGAGVSGLVTAKYVQLECSHPDSR